MGDLLELVSGDFLEVPTANTLQLLCNSRIGFSFTADLLANKLVEVIDYRFMNSDKFSVCCAS